MKKLIPLLLLFAGCRSVDHSNTITSMQTIDRNGFCETISNKDRLVTYQGIDFLASQPYEKVLRVYGKNHEGKSRSKITSYHPNGSHWQYLEALDGRANGRYLEWHENGKLKIEANVMEGVADLTESAQISWLFDEKCTVWDERGNLQAEFTYSRGHLEGEATYYFPTGNIEKVVQYTHGLIHGDYLRFDEEGNTIEQIHYVNGRKNGPASGCWSKEQPKYQEEYEEDLLINGTYFNPIGEVSSEIKNGHGVKSDFHENTLYATLEYNNGIPEGIVKLYDEKGQLVSSYQIQEGMKSGEEWKYYPSNGKEPKQQLMISWFEDQIQGMTKTWYENGTLESQREMCGNKKHGLSFAYYKTGELMLMEEYENDRLIQGSYYKKGEQTPASIIDKGEGIATIFSPEGHFLKKITYERSHPLVD